MFRIVLAASIAAALAQSVSAKPWAVGNVREVDEGYYITLLDAHDGWRIWQVETKEGTYCKAIKPAIGRVNPAPLGVDDHFAGGFPFLVVSKGHKGFAQYGRLWRFKLEGKWGNSGAKFRAAGEKFWTEWKHDQDISNFDGSKIEVNVVSWEYPHSMVGLADEKGTLDLTGLSSVVEAVEKCGTLDY